MAVSIREVAKKAGVAIGTVSRVFNHYPDVLPETQEKVMRAARELNYIPNANARSLSAKKPPNICLIASDLLSGDDRDSMLYLEIKGIIAYADEHHLELSILNTDSSRQRSTSFVDFCHLHAISGAIVTGMKTDDPYFRELVESDIPVVGIDLPIEGVKACWISADNVQASRDAVKGLFDRGLRNILIVAGRKNAAVNDERLAGVRQAYENEGRRLEEESVLYADFDEELARIRTDEWLSSHPAPDAVFCFSDLMAVGVMKTLTARGLRIPEDVSVMGFDGTPFSSLLTPPLATVSQEVRRMGYEAAGMVHAMMEDRETDGHRIVPHTIVYRESVRKA